MPVAGAPAPPDNWLFGHLTPYCNSSLQDKYNDLLGAHDPLGKAIMTAIYAACFLFVVYSPKRIEGIGARTSAAGLASLEDLAKQSDAGLRQPPQQSSKPAERWVMLDIARIVCVAAVVAEHSGGTVYSEYNTGFVTHWVLQWLFVISGIAFMMSKASFGSYFLRCMLHRPQSRSSPLLAFLPASEPSFFLCRIHLRRLDPYSLL